MEHRQPIVVKLGGRIIQHRAGHRPEPSSRQTSFSWAIRSAAASSFCWPREIRSLTK